MIGVVVPCHIPKKLGLRVNSLAALFVDRGNEVSPIDKGYRLQNAIFLLGYDYLTFKVSCAPICSEASSVE